MDGHVPMSIWAPQIGLTGLFIKGERGRGHEIGKGSGGKRWTCDQFRGKSGGK